jgi:hypothetical protein
VVKLTSELARISEALGRTLRWTYGSIEVQVRVEQVCPICAIPLVLWFVLHGEDIAVERLHRELFPVYDDHRCHATDLEPMFEAAERELVRSAERIALIEDPILKQRAEHEADRMAVFAYELRKRLVSD